MRREIGRALNATRAMAQCCPQCGGDLPADVLEGLCPRCVASCLREFEHHDVDTGEGISESPSLAGIKELARPITTATGPGPAIASPKGERFFDYELLEEIGRGGMGVVYRARQLSLNRIVAVKTILSGPVASAEAVRRFRDEAAALAHLKHPNIVAIYDIFDRDGHNFFSMEYVPGKSLAELVSQHPLPAAAAARYAEKIARAIQFAHDNGLLHRDLKPSNILVDSFDEPRVTDFGLAKRLNAEADLSYTGQLIGSPQYFAPEQLSPKKGAVGPRTDVYSIGAVLYHLLTGRAPFNAASLEEVLLKVIDTEPVPPRSVVHRIPRDLETICLKCLEKEPARRYGSAREVAEDLTRFLAYEPIKARPVHAAERAWRWLGRRKALAGAWAAVLLLLTAFIWVLSRKLPGATASQPPPPTVAYTFADRAFHDTNWTLTVEGLSDMTQLHAGLISGYTNPPFPICTNPVRELTYRMGSNSTFLAYHVCSNATYDPALSGEIKELTVSIKAHQIDGAGNTRVAPCLKQDGRLYSYTRPQAASTFELAEILYRGMRAADFSVAKAGDYEPGRHPDFSPQGKPIQFGFLVRDTDPKRGHYGWVAVSSFSVTAFGPPPGSFPFTDGALDERDWTVREIRDGNPVTWQEDRERTGGNPDKFVKLRLKLGDRTGLDLIHLSSQAIYAPGTQGALESIDVSLDTRMAPESSGRSANPNICPVLVQNGTVYNAGWRMAAYSEQNGGWVPLDFMGLGKQQFVLYIGLKGALGPNAPLDFSTNGAPIRFGFATRTVTFYNNPQGHAFSTAIDFDNFTVKMHPARKPL